MRQQKDLKQTPAIVVHQYVLDDGRERSTVAIALDPDLIPVGPHVG
jgi:hypothetical protein